MESEENRVSQARKKWRDQKSDEFLSHIDKLVAQANADTLAKRSEPTGLALALTDAPAEPTEVVEREPEKAEVEQAKEAAQAVPEAEAAEAISEPEIAEGRSADAKIVPPEAKEDEDESGQAKTMQPDQETEIEKSKKEKKDKKESKERKKDEKKDKKRKKEVSEGVDLRKMFKKS